MTEQEASLIIGDMPIPKDNMQYSWAEYQEAKAMAINALVENAAIRYMNRKTELTEQEEFEQQRMCIDCKHFGTMKGNDGTCDKDPSMLSNPAAEQCNRWEGSRDD